MRFLTLLLLMAACSSFAAISVYFSPAGGTEAALIREIDSAKKGIFVMAYELTNKNIADALVRAEARKVLVNVIVDSSQRRPATNGVQFCCAWSVAQSVSVLLDAKHAIFHDKVLVVDGVRVATGSFNYSNAAEHANAENLVVISDKPLAAKYLANWQLHAAHSEKF